ncbi:MAG: acyl-CoA dehydrogenase family protein, partial [Chthonomonadales bacterium]
ANDVDQAVSPPVENIQLLAENGLLGLTTSRECGGIGAPASVVRKYTEILSAACGTTTFIQGQHQSACTLIAAGKNESLKSELLPVFASGKRIVGVAFAHVRRPGPPILRVSQSADGYIFDGSAAWFTGWGVMTDVLIAGTLPDGNYVYVVIPLKQGEALTATPPMELAAMNATGTVSLNCHELFVPRDRTVKVISPETMQESDSLAVLSVTSQIFGMTTAAIRLLRKNYEKSNSGEVLAAVQAVEAELDLARQAVDFWRENSQLSDYLDNALSVRARCIEMGVRAAHCALTASSGGANMRSHTAQRLFREAMFYTLTAQTDAVRRATLKRLTESSQSAAGGLRNPE